MLFAVRGFGALVILVGLPFLLGDLARHLDGVLGAGNASAELFAWLKDHLWGLLPHVADGDTLARIVEHPAVRAASEWANGPMLAGIGVLLVTVSLIGRKRSAPRISSAATGSERAANPQPVQAAVVVSTTQMDAFDREFLPAALELLETPPSPVRVAGIWLTCVAFAAGLAWSYFGWLDIHAVAYGRIQPSGRSKIVQPLEPGRVIAIGVENGSRVVAADVLVELDPTESGADREALARDLESGRAEAARRRLAIALAGKETPERQHIIFPKGTGDGIRQREENVLAADLGQLRSSRSSLLAQHAERLAARDRLSASIAARDRLLELTKERVDMRETLNEKGSLSRALVIDSLQQYETHMTTQVSERGQLAEAVASLATLERKIEEGTSQFVADQTQKLAEAERKSDRLEQELIKAKSKNERVTLRAPISGTVQQLAVTTIGQVVTTGQPLMTIVPFDSPIEIEAMIQNKDIGFVEPGQSATVKVESFPFTRYGTIDATVLKVSRDAVDEREASALSDPSGAAKPQSAGAATAPKSQTLVFPATIGLTRRTINVDGKDIPLSPGMAVVVEIRTGQRRAIDYVLSPLREVTASTGHER